MLGGGSRIVCVEKDVDWENGSISDPEATNDVGVPSVGVASSMLMRSARFISGAGESCAMSKVA